MCLTGGRKGMIFMNQFCEYKLSNGGKFKVNKFNFKTAVTNYYTLSDPISSALFYETLKQFITKFTAIKDHARI